VCCVLCAWCVVRFGFEFCIFVFFHLAVLYCCVPSVSVCSRPREHATTLSCMCTLHIAYSTLLACALLLAFGAFLSGGFVGRSGAGAGVPGGVCAERRFVSVFRIFSLFFSSLPLLLGACVLCVCHPQCGSCGLQARRPAAQGSQPPGAVLFIWICGRGSLQLAASVAFMLLLRSIAAALFFCAARSAFY
jgi:hypothetical protein